MYLFMYLQVISSAENKKKTEIWGWGMASTLISKLSGLTLHNCVQTHTHLVKVIAIGHVDLGILALQFCLTFGHTVGNILNLLNSLQSSHVFSSNVINTESFPMRKHGTRCNFSSLHRIHAFEAWQPILSCL